MDIEHLQLKVMTNRIKHCKFILKPKTNRLTEDYTLCLLWNNQ